MNIRLRHLLLRTKKTVERVEFSETATFIYGPIGKGKSTVARLIDYCLGGDLERTPAIQSEFVSTELILELGSNRCTIERSANESSSVRLTWVNDGGLANSVIAPFDAGDSPLITSEAVYNLSDLLFFLCGSSPIKVRKNRSDPDSPMIRLGFRDVWWYCYLEQTHLDSSFFHLDEPFKGRKSQDALRFFTGLHSERLSEIEADLVRTQDEQRTKREAVTQIRLFMQRFQLGTELEIAGQILELTSRLQELRGKKSDMEAGRFAKSHPTDELRVKLRGFGKMIEEVSSAVADSQRLLAEQASLHAELLTAKTKALRIERAGRYLDLAPLENCPECGHDISDRPHDHLYCRLCGSEKVLDPEDPTYQEAQRRDLNERIDQISDSMLRREREIAKLYRELKALTDEKAALDSRLVEELTRYDSTFVEQIRASERDIATTTERIRSLEHLRTMPEAIANLELEAGLLQGRIDSLRLSFEAERDRLKQADVFIDQIAKKFHQVLLSVRFPGVRASDSVILDPRNWKPYVVYGDTSWTFWDTGSGGKKTLFNVCYALAIHAVAINNDLPVPNLLIIDSPTKNISEDMDPDLVKALYSEIYGLASRLPNGGIQLLLIDSELVQPDDGFPGFLERRMAGEADAPSLISYYDGP